MSKNEKLVKRLYSIPKNFKWEELEKVLSYLGFEKLEGSGSRVKFFNDERNLMISLHRPHPQPELKCYQVKQVLEVLVSGGLL